jgi:hypothetical protein
MCGLVVAALDVTDPLLLLVAAGAVVVMLPVAPLLAGRRFDVFEPVYLFAFCYAVLFVIRPLFDITQRFPSVGGVDPAPGYGLALLLGVAGAISFLAGYYAPAGASIGRRLGHPPAMLDAGSLGLYTVVCATVAIGLFGAFIAMSGGVPALLAILSGRSTIWFELFSQPAGYLFSGLLGLAGIGVLLLATSDSWRSGRGAAGMVLLFLSQIIFVFTGGRIWVIPVTIAVIVLWHLRRGRRPRLAVVTAVAAPAFLLGIMLPVAYRNVHTRDGTVLDAAARLASDPGQAVTQFFSTLDTAMVATLAVEVQYVPSVMPFEFGATYLEALTRPIPRALWPDKPREGDVRLMETIWPDLRRVTQFTFSGFGEPYMNWGLPGVIGVFVVLGAAWRTLYEWLMSERSNHLTEAVFAISLPFVIVYMRGGIGVDYQRQVIFLVPLLVGAWYASVRKQPHEGTASGAPGSGVADANAAPAAAAWRP